MQNYTYICCVWYKGQRKYMCHLKPFRSVKWEILPLDDKYVLKVVTCDIAKIQLFLYIMFFRSLCIHIKLMIYI